MLVFLSESVGQHELGRNMIRKHASAPVLKIHPHSGADAARSHMHPDKSCPSDQQKGYTQGGPFAELPSSSSSCFPLLKFSLVGCGSKRDTSVCWSAQASPGGWEERATPHARRDGRGLPEPSAPGSHISRCTVWPGAGFPTYCLSARLTSGSGGGLGGQSTAPGRGASRSGAGLAWSSVAGDLLPLGLSNTGDALMCSRGKASVRH